MIDSEELGPAFVARNEELDRRLRASIARFYEEIEKVNKVIEAEEVYLRDELGVRLEARVLISREHERDRILGANVLANLTCSTNLYYGKHEGKKFGLWIETVRTDLVTEELSTRSYLALRSSSKELRMDALKMIPLLREEILRVYEKATEDLGGEKS